MNPLVKIVRKNLVDFVTIPKSLIKRIGLKKAAIVSELYSAAERFSDADGWFYLTADNICSETGITIDDKTARSFLAENEFFESKKEGVPCRKYYRLTSKGAGMILGLDDSEIECFEQSYQVHQSKKQTASEQEQVISPSSIGNLPIQEQVISPSSIGNLPIQEQVIYPSSIGNLPIQEQVNYPYIHYISKRTKETYKETKEREETFSGTNSMEAEKKSCESSPQRKNAENDCFVEEKSDVNPPTPRTPHQLPSAVSSCPNTTKDTTQIKSPPECLSVAQRTYPDEEKSYACDYVEKSELSEPVKTALLNYVRCRESDDGKPMNSKIEPFVRTFLAHYGMNTITTQVAIIDQATAGGWKTITKRQWGSQSLFEQKDKYSYSDPERYKNSDLATPKEKIVF